MVYQSRVPRFSSQAKEVFDTVFYKTEIQLAQNQIEKIDNPLDKAFAKIWTLYYYIQSRDFPKQLETLKDIEHLEYGEDDLVTYFVACHYFFYYSGIFEMIIDYSKSEYYFNLVKESYRSLEYEDE